jgi:tetratricopeptide (TPR) repeat protein
MDRVLARTLYSLSAAYQRHVRADAYEVILVDNGSPKPISPAVFEGLEGNFRLLRIDNAPPSPAAAINLAAKAARADQLGVMIDGGRLATPGLIHGAIHGLGLYPDALVASLGWYVGDDLQGRALDHGHTPAREDALLSSIDWPHDGYRLFEIGTFDESSLDGWFYPINESNSLFLSKRRFNELGGYDEAFDVPGGGLVNLDFYARAAAPMRGGGNRELVMLLGEATFHQVHGGISTNAPLEAQQNNWDRWHGQYVALRGQAFTPPNPRRTYLGVLPQAALQRFARALVKPSFPLAPDEAMGQVSHHALGADFDRTLWRSGDQATSAPPGDPIAADILAMAQHAFTSDLGATARALAQLVLDIEPETIEARRLVRLTAQDRVAPGGLAAHLATLGAALLKLGRRDQALAAFHQALEHDADCTPARWAMAHDRLTGPDYLSRLTQLHALLAPALYVEIGVFEGASMALVPATTRAVGIDPKPRLFTAPQAPVLILPVTSDAQFAKPDPRADWGGARINFGFIDGLHVFDQALRDFAYLEAHTAKGAVIAAHDTLPFDRITAERERVTNFHSGDVWKLIPFLSAHRPDLDVMTIKTPPTGLTLITGLNPDFDWQPLLQDSVIAPFRDLDFDVQFRDPTGVLKLIDNDWELIRSRLAKHMSTDHHQGIES